MKASDPNLDEAYSRVGLCKEYHVLVGETLKLQPALQLTCEHEIGSWQQKTYEFLPMDHGRHVVTFNDGKQAYPVDIWVHLDYRTMVKRGCGLPPSPGGWDAGISLCSIIEQDGKFYMFYGGVPDRWWESKHPEQGIGLAVSTDLLHWEKYSGNPLLTSSRHSWLPAEETSQFGIPRVAKLGDTYVMYYDVYTHFGENDRWEAGRPDTESIGVATSKDLYHWTPYPGNPILTASEPWEGTCFYAPAVLSENGLIYMFYTGHSEGQCHMGVAISNDGIHFEKHKANPIYDCFKRGT